MNSVLQQNHFPAHPNEDYKLFIGNGLNKTKPYAGITGLLDELASRRVRIRYQFDPGIPAAF